MQVMCAAAYQVAVTCLRDAFAGKTRFDEFEKSLGIAPNMLSRRLAGLVEAGLLERRRYNERPPRDEYVLTERGRDFRPVCWALAVYGYRHFAPEGESFRIVDAATGAPAEPMLIDRHSGRPLIDPDFKVVHVPAPPARINAEPAHEGARGPSSRSRKPKASSFAAGRQPPRAAPLDAQTSTASNGGAKSGASNSSTHTSGSRET